MKLLLSIFLFLFSLAAYSQQLHIDSTRFITGNKSGTGIYYAIPTADKGILFVGDEANNPGGIIPTLPIDTVLDNVMIGKIDSNQKISWVKVYGGTQDDGAVSVCQTPDGGYAVLATTLSTNGDVTSSKGANDMWLLRLDGSGNLLWEKSYGSSRDDISISVDNTPDGGFILFGYTNGSDGYVPFHYGSTWTFDWLVIKTDGSGNIQWTKDLGTSGDEGETGSILSIDSSYYLVAATVSADHDCTNTNWHKSVGTGYDVYVLKLDNAGNVLWDSSYGGSANDNATNAMYDIRDSTIMITGWTKSNDYMVNGNKGNVDMWALKVNRQGTLVWAKTMGGTEQDEGTGICAGPNGGYMVYGWTYPGPTHGGDCCLFAISSTGDELNNKIFGGTDAEQHVYSVLPYLNGFVATGISASDTFTEGSSYGRNCIGEDGFISYIGYGTLGIKPLPSTAEQNMITYPNPCKNKTGIALSSIQDGNLAIISSIGQVIYTRQTEGVNQRVEVATENWPNGVYLIKWQGEDGSVLTTKLIKN
jgi:hypothetical protein